MSNVQVEIKEDDGGLLPIGIAAIVIGAVAGLILFIVLVCMCCFRDRRRRFCGGDWCGGWQRKRVIVIRRNKDKPKMQVVQQAQEPQRMVIKAADDNTATLPIYTLPTYIRGNHMRPWMSTEKRQRFIKLNGSLDSTQSLRVVPQQKAITMGPTIKVVANRQSVTSPTAYLQRGGSLRLTTMKEDAVLTSGGTTSNGVLRQASSVLTQVEPQSPSYTIVRSTCDEPQGSVVGGGHFAMQPSSATTQFTMQAPSQITMPAPFPMATQFTMPAPSAIPAQISMPTIQATIPIQTSNIPMATMYPQQQAATAFIQANPTYEMMSTYQQPTYEIQGAAQGPDLSGASATINVVQDPYSLVETVNADQDQIYVQGGEQNGYVGYTHQQC